MEGRAQQSSRLAPRLAANLLMHNIKLLRTSRADRSGRVTARGEVRGQAGSKTLPRLHASGARVRQRVTPVRPRPREPPSTAYHTSSPHQAPQEPSDPRHHPKEGRERPQESKSRKPSPRRRPSGESRAPSALSAAFSPSCPGPPGSSSLWGREGWSQQERGGGSSGVCPQGAVLPEAAARRAQSQVRKNSEMERGRWQQTGTAPAGWASVRRGAGAAPAFRAQCPGQFSHLSLPWETLSGGLLEARSPQTRQGLIGTLLWRGDVPFAPPVRG